MTTLTDAQRLADAEAALHKIKTGRMAVEVDVDGRKVRFSRVTIADLEGYRNELQDRVAGRCVRFGAIGFYL